MEQRTLDVIIGDWSEDGHGKTDKHTVLLQGSDVSDDHLNKTFTNNVELTGVNPVELFNDYRQYHMSEDDWNKIVDAGFTPDPKMEMVGVAYHAENQYYYANSFVELLLWYVTNNTDTTWEIITNPILFGDFDPVINDAKSKHLGYGLFD